MDLIIIGVGQFGSALAQIYERQGRRVHKIQNSRSPFEAPASMLARSVTLLCVPTQALPELMEQRGDLLLKSHSLVSTAKGLLQKTGDTATRFLTKKILSKSQGPAVFALSGPSFASEIKKGQPTALVLASKDPGSMDSTIEFLSTPQLRLYKSSDPFGVELCGALKNVYAIAAGVSAGLGFGDSTRAALNTRALAEMSRIGKVLGVQPLTFFGLAGVGDLFLTCSSHQSRNFQFGLGLAQGKSTESLLKKLGTVEGVWTAAVARKICKKHDLRAPLIDAVVALLEKRLKPQDALEKLMTRKIRHEFE